MGLTEMMSSGTPVPERRRRRRWLGCLPLVLLLVVVVGVGWFLGAQHNLLPLPLVEGCVASTPDGIVDLDVQQMDNASTITAVSVSRDLPERADTIALATAMQESKLENLSGGDLDSVGLFQQRPSEGWGEATQIEDPVYATDKFLDRLVAVPGYTELPLTVAAQDVQHSGYPDAYAQHEGDATVLSGALGGRIPAATTCQVNSVGTADSAAAGTTALGWRLGQGVRPGGADPGGTGHRRGLFGLLRPGPLRLGRTGDRPAERVHQGGADQRGPARLGGGLVGGGALPGPASHRGELRRRAVDLGGFHQGLAAAGDRLRLGVPLRPDPCLGLGAGAGHRRRAVARRARTPHPQG
ncbi:hypothetical protein GXW82_28260 [Streptacidiphilus sp. 4-A2]|nr:hypothetical protein [Streptacidiphilus sp. 4-A2]